MAARRIGVRCPDVKQIDADRPGVQRTCRIEFD